MGNRIPRNARRLEVVYKFGNYGKMSVKKDKYGQWIGTDENGKRWLCLVGHLRNSDFCSLTVIE